MVVPCHHYRQQDGFYKTQVLKLLWQRAEKVTNYLKSIVFISAWKLKIQLLRNLKCFQLIRERQGIPFLGNKGFHQATSFFLVFHEASKVRKRILLVISYRNIKRDATLTSIGTREIHKVKSNYTPPYFQLRH